MSLENSPTSSVSAVPNDLQEPGQVDEVKKSESTESASTESATEENGATDQSSETTQDEGSKDGEPDSKWIGRRLERAKAKERASVQAEIDYWKNAALGKTNETNPQSTQSTQTTATKPVFSDYDNIETYTEAVADWKLEQKFEQFNQKSKVEQVYETYSKRADSFAKTTPDFNDTVAAFIADYEGVDVPELTTVAMESEVGPQLVHFLAKNSHEMERIIDLPSHRRLIELGKLEDKLTKPVKAEPAKVTKAPTPVTPVSGTSVVTKTLEDIAKDSSESNRAWRELRMKQRAGR